MKINNIREINSEYIYYSHRHGKTGKLFSVDFNNINNDFLLEFINEFDKETFAVSSKNELDGLEEFKKISESKGIGIYDGTVIRLKRSGAYYRISKINSFPYLVALDESLSEIDSIFINAIPLKDISGILNSASIVGHIKEIEFKKNFDFDVKIFKHKSSDTFFYAGNMKDSKTIDLVKVIFVGSDLLGGEYIRKNYTYSEFSDLLSDEVIIESNEKELYEYAYSLILGNK